MPSKGKPKVGSANPRRREEVTSHVHIREQRGVTQCEGARLRESRVEFQEPKHVARWTGLRDDSGEAVRGQVGKVLKSYSGLGALSYGGLKPSKGFNPRTAPIYSAL